MSLAQDEVDCLFNQKDKVSTHPEDTVDNESNSSESDQGSRTYVHSDTDTDVTKNSYTMATATATYHVPTTLFDANTGPKGVIADAQSFERAKKRSFRKTLLNFTSFQPSTKSRLEPPNSQEKASSAENSASEDDEEFMRQWRENRMQELQVGRRRASPSKKKYGSLDVVDANGYLDAVEKVPADTVVVVCIYDPESNASAAVEDALESLAHKHATTRFVKLHHEIAEMDHVGTPALLAYKGGDVFATLVDIHDHLPAGRTCDSTGVEELMKQNNVL